MRALAPRVLAGALLAVAALPPALQAQVQPAAARPAAAAPAVMQTLLRDLDMLERKIVGLAEAMPETSWSWRPGEGVRSVGEVAMHVAADNWFLPTVAGVAAPAASGIRAGDYASVQAYEARAADKAAALAELRASFAHLRKAMQETDAAFLGRQLQVFGQDMSGLDLWYLTMTHLHEHLGQAIAYARANGVVPPWSRGN